MRNLVVRRGDTLVIDGLTLTVEPSQVVGLVGPSGCGKSTLLDVLAGLLTPTAGHAEVGGVTARQGVDTGLALMPQTDALLPWRTVADNVALAAVLGGATSTDARRAADAALARVGLTGFGDHYPHALSGGMRQRASMARTLLADRRGWLLDEPFGAVDALTRQELRDDLRATWQRERPTVLLVTHDIEEAAALCDRVVVCGPRPMSATDEVEITLPHPRALADLAPLREQITGLLRQRTAKAPA